MVSNKKNLLTKDWYEKLLKELKELKEVKYPNILERIAEAKAMWDLSENFEYKSAQEDRDLTTARISEIENLIDNVEIIKENKGSNKKDKKVDYGSKVTLELEDGKKYEVTIVWSWEVNLEDWLNISLESPIGTAIKGKKIGDTTKMKLMHGKQDIKIIDIK